MSRQARGLMGFLAVGGALLSGCAGRERADPFDPHEACRAEQEQSLADARSALAAKERELGVAQDDIEVLRRHAEGLERQLAASRENTAQQQLAAEAALSMLKAKDAQLIETRAELEQLKTGPAPSDDVAGPAVALLRQKDQQLEALREELVRARGGESRVIDPAVARGIRATSLDLDKPVASVDGQTISRREMAEFLFADMANRSLVDLCVNRHLVLRAAARAGITVSDVEAETWVSAQLLEQVAQAGGEAGWLQRLEEMGWDRASWEARVRYQARPMLLLERLVARERETPPGQALFQARLRAAYEEAHSTRVSARHILFAVPPDANDAQLAQALRAAELTAAELQRGASFQDLAMRVSMDPETRRLGGYLGEFGREKFAALPELNTALFTLEPGRPSRPIRTQRGYHLVLVDSRREPSRAFDERMQRELAERLRAQPAAPEEQAAVVARLRREATIQVMLGF